MRKLAQVVLVTALVYAVAGFWVIDCVAQAFESVTGDDENWIYDIAWRWLQAVGYAEIYALYDGLRYEVPAYYND